MASRAQIIGLLSALSFEDKGSNVYEKKYSSDCTIKVDLTNEKISYPEDKGLKVNDQTTCNFAHDENFVVFECVDRLLEKGYSPSCIELEPRWNLGRDKKGGKADILIKDNNGDEFLIIECKKDAEEFRKSWKKMLVDGDQLFSYAQQIKKTKLLN